MVHIEIEIDFILLAGSHVEKIADARWSAQRRASSQGLGGDVEVVVTDAAAHFPIVFKLKVHININRSVDIPTAKVPARPVIVVEGGSSKRTKRIGNSITSPCKMVDFICPR